MGGLTQAGVKDLMEATSQQALDEDGRALAAAVHAETEGNSVMVTPTSWPTSRYRSGVDQVAAPPPGPTAVTMNLPSLATTDVMVASKESSVKFTPESWPVERS